MKLSLQSLAALLTALTAAVSLTSQAGCVFQSPIQTSPSGGGGLNDDIEYFEPGPEFKQQREAAARKAYQADLEAQQAGQQGP